MSQDEIMQSSKNGLGSFTPHNHSTTSIMNETHHRESYNPFQHMRHFEENGESEQLESNPTTTFCTQQRMPKLKYQGRHHVSFYLLKLNLLRVILIFYINIWCLNISFLYNLGSLADVAMAIDKIFRFMFPVVYIVFISSYFCKYVD